MIFKSFLYLLSIMQLKKHLLATLLIVWHLDKLNISSNKAGKLSHYTLGGTVSATSGPINATLFGSGNVLIGMKLRQ